ncbi:helix-turn-helix domain-containing protein [Plantactinospora sp. WMMB782]|uniref:helix-turn-helix domain-containing protein n=1 Tax=Plantactinospora sp. WMMB782 TaxID=3404121 RepID=UPI003B96689B
MSTDEVIGANLARVRDQRGLSLRRLAEHLAAIGRPINADGLNRAEKGRRQISAAELVALAVVLDVSPLTLLLPHDPTPDGVPLTPEVVADWQAAWRWAVGEQPLTRRGESVDLVDPKVSAYIRENRPHEANSIVDEIGRFLVARSGGNPNRLRYVVEVEQDGRGGFGGRYTVTTAGGDDGER